MSTFRRLATLAALATVTLALAPAVPAAAAPSLDGVALVADDNSTLGYAPIHDLHGGRPDNATYLDVLDNDSLGGLDRSEYTVEVAETGEQAYVGELWWDPIADRVAVSDLRGGQYVDATYFPAEVTQTLRYRLCLVASAECTDWADASLIVTDTGPAPGAADPADGLPRNRNVPCAAGSSGCYQGAVAASREGRAYTVAYDYSALLADGGRVVLAENGHQWTPSVPQRATYAFDADTGILTVSVAAGAGWVTASGQHVAQAPSPAQCGAVGERVYAVEVPPVSLNAQGGVVDFTPVWPGTEIASICAGGGGDNPAQRTRARDDLAVGQAAKPIQIDVLANDRWKGQPQITLLDVPSGIAARVVGRHVTVTIPRRLAGRTVAVGRYRLCADGGCEIASVRVRTAPMIVTGATHEVPTDGAQASSALPAQGSRVGLALPLSAGLLAMLGALGLAHMRGRRAAR